MSETTETKRQQIWLAISIFCCGVGVYNPWFLILACISLMVSYKK